MQKTIATKFIALILLSTLVIQRVVADDDDDDGAGIIELIEFFNSCVIMYRIGETIGFFNTFVVTTVMVAFLATVVYYSPAPDAPPVRRRCKPSTLYKIGLCAATVNNIEYLSQR